MSNFWGSLQNPKEENPFTNEELTDAELNENEENLFTRENFRGASIRKGKVGSLYFGGTSLKDDFSWRKRRKISGCVKKYLKLRYLGNLTQKQVNKKTQIKNELIGYLSQTKSGGRVRTTHRSAPETSNYDHVLRMEDPRKGKKGKLLEVMLSNSGGIVTHPSRGALIKADAFGLGKAKIARKIGKKLQTEDFQSLAKNAKAAAKHYKANKSGESSATESNQRFLDSLSRKIKKRIPMNPI